MAAGTVPIFPKAVRHCVAKPTAQSSGEGDGDNVDLVVAGADGTRVDDLWSYATATPGGVGYIFFNDGSNEYLAAVVLLNSGAIRRPTGMNFPLFLPSGWKIRVGDANASPVGRFHARVADY